MPAKEGRASHLVTDRWVGQWTDIVRFTGSKLVTEPSQNAQVYDSEADSIIRYPPSGSLVKRMSNSRFPKDSCLPAVLLILTFA